MLVVSQVNSFHGNIQALWNVSLEIDAAELLPEDSSSLSRQTPPISVPRQTLEIVFPDPDPIIVYSGEIIG